MENIFKRASARTLNGVPVKFEEIDDAGDPALARTIANSLASKPETLMVVGHVSSSNHEEALPVYMNAEPQIPVILTTETNPHILPASADPDEEFPVFRLSPTDDDQAKSAYQFARIGRATILGGRRPGQCCLHKISGKQVSGRRPAQYHAEFCCIPQ